MVCAGAGRDTKRVNTRTEIVVEGKPACIGVDPVMVVPVQPVPKSDIFRIRKIQGGVAQFDGSCPPGNAHQTSLGMRDSIDGYVFHKSWERRAMRTSRF